MPTLQEKLSGAGMDQLDPSSSMPLIKLLNAQSPEVIDPAKKIRGASSGDFLFQGEVIPAPFEFIVVAKSTVYAEWRPKSEGGGLVAHHPITVVGAPDYHKGSVRSEWDEFLGSNDLIRTMYYGIKFKKGDEWVDAILAFTKNSLSKAGRPLNDMIMKFKYPPADTQIPFLFSQTYLMESFFDSNDKGSWFNWKVTPGRVLDFTEDASLLEDAFETQREIRLSLPAPGQVVHKAITDNSEVIDVESGESVF